LLLTLIGFRLCDATEIAVVEAVAVSARDCTGPADTAMQYWIEEGSTKAKYVKNSGLFQPLKRKENALVLWHGSFVGPKLDWTELSYKSD
jgi:hypothetical protein